MKRRVAREVAAKAKRPTYATSDDRWQAIVERTAGADGHFVYGVRTTGVYCRPCCASRRPNRANVVFFESSVAARVAGFRACRRCRPDAASAAEPQVQRLVEACRFMERCRHCPSLDEVTRAAGLSRAQLQRLFQRHLAITPKAYAAAVRVARLKRELARGEVVSKAIHAAGFGSQSRCYEKTGTTLGMTPGAYRRKGAKMGIGYLLADCSLGRMLVAATELGVCHIALGDDDSKLIEDLHASFPAARSAEADSKFGAMVRRVVSELDAGATCSFPLDIRGTAFQARVWRALRAIPTGETFTYSELAAAIEQPRAVRAVASACAANAIAVAIPCHRAVRADGGLGGYRWGLKRKSELLRRERAAAAAAKKGDA